MVKLRASLFGHVSGLFMFTLCMGADCFPTDSSSDGGFVGFGGPAFELTVDGTHLGPYALGTGAHADIVTNRNALGQVVSSDLTIHATGGNATCDFHVSRFGMGIAPFGQAAYRILAAVGAATPDGSGSPVGGITATGGTVVLACNGSDCDGAVLSNTVFDATHVEGYVSANLSQRTSGQPLSVICSYYLPWGTYQP